MIIDYCFHIEPRRAVAATVLSQLGRLSEAKARHRAIRSMASSLECAIGAAGGFTYAALLGFQPGISNTETIHQFVERQIDAEGHLPNLLELNRRLRRALDDARQATQEE